MLKDRQDAGRQLGRVLGKLRNREVLVLAMARGGMQIGCEVAQALNADLAMIIARPLVYPGITEPSDGGASLSGATIFGAMAEDGSVFIHREAERRLRPEIIESGEDSSATGDRAPDCRATKGAPAAGARGAVPHPG